MDEKRFCATLYCPTCYFLLNFVGYKRIEVNGKKVVIVLLFSFEFCLAEELGIPPEELLEDLLFSFEFCGNSGGPIVDVDGNIILLFSFEFCRT